MREGVRWQAAFQKSLRDLLTELTNFKNHYTTHRDRSVFREKVLITDALCFLQKLFVFLFGNCQCWPFKFSVVLLLYD